MDCPEGYNLIDVESKPVTEKDFFKSYNYLLENKKKLIVFNNKNVVENPVSSLIRYVIFNSNHKII
jgi:hypothetical protein